jgi:hypothetical protein
MTLVIVYRVPAALGKLMHLQNASDHGLSRSSTRYLFNETQRAEITEEVVGIHVLPSR